MVVARAAKAGVLAGVAVFAAVAVAAVSDFDPGAFFSDDAEPVEIASVEKSPLRRAADRKTPSQPVIRVLNSGAVDDDPERHAIAVAALERAASQPVDAVTDDDDLTPTGSYADWYPAKLKTYRTVCVRLCDGALTPISFATTHDRLALDALRCRKSCGSPSKLYIQKNPASDADKLVDLDGKPYADLSTAHKFRTSYDQACTCRPHAWQGVARARHRLFEIQARMRHGREVAHGRLDVIKAAASKSLRVARHSPKTGSAIETGSAAKAPVAPAEMQVVVGADASAQTQIEQDIVAPIQLKPSRKSASKRKGKGTALAKANGKSGKADSATAFLVLFGAGPATDVAKPGKLTPVIRPLNSFVRAEVSTRRYDGNDWRISNYEPM